MPCLGRRLALAGFLAAALLRPALAEPPKFQVDPTWPLTSAEQLDHRRHRRHYGRCAGSYLDQPAPELARCPREARLDRRRT